MSRRLLRLQSWGIAAALMVAGSIPAFSQTNQVSVDFADGTSALVSPSTHKRIAFGPAQSSAPVTSSVVATPGLSFYTASYSSLGKATNFNIVGTDPSLGAATTTIPTTIVPLKIVFSSGVVIDGTTTVPATINSPLFQTADYTVGGTDVGTTQYGDAIQRGEFWNLPGFDQTGYHVLLGQPTVQPTVTVTVPAGKGSAFRLRSGGLLGVVDLNFFNGVLATLVPNFTADQLPIFVTDNVFLSPGGGLTGCCILGFHNSEGPPIKTARTFIYAAFTESGTFGGNTILDVQPLSHEVAEWLNDPFVGTPLLGGINLIAPAVLPGTGGACIINFETGDPLEAPPIVFTQTINGTTYHLQDEALLPWYLHTNPSFSLNGTYSFLGAFKTPSTLCGAG
jgi:hypothetical protein